MKEIMKKPYYNNLDYEEQIKDFFEEGKKLWAKSKKNQKRTHI